MGQNKKWYDFKFFLAFAAPTAFIFVTVMLIPFIYGLAMSFTDTNGVSSTNQFVGLQNYIKVFQDKVFWTSMVVTLKYVLGCVVLTNLLAFIIAYLLTTGIRGQNFLRAAFFTPNLLGGIVLGLVWRFVFQNALVYVGTSLHIPIFEQSWLADPNKALVTLIIVTVWQLSGYMMIIYIAGIQNIPTDIEESARMDGANGWQMLRHITIPSVMPSITICTFLTLTNSFKLFDQNLALNGGQPFIFKDGTTIRTTEMLALNIYNTFYGSANSRGVGQAKAVLFFLLVGAIGLLQLRSTKSKEVQR